jgi:Holliday junction resolvasome RuvABC ATP-dependent DNA helicase subunit
MKKNIICIIYLGLFAGQAMADMFSNSDKQLIKEFSDLLTNMRLNINVLPDAQAVEETMNAFANAFAKDAKNKNGALSTIKKAVKEELPSAQEVGESVGKMFTEGMRGTRKEGAAVGTEIAGLFGDALQNAAKELNNQTDSIANELVGAQNKMLNRVTGNFEMNVGPAARKIKNTIAWNLLHPYDIAKYASIVGLGVGGTYFLAYYAPGIAKEYIMKTFITPRPTILLPGSKIGTWDRFARWKNGYTSPEMIFATEVKEQLTDLVGITDMIKKDIKTGLKRTYRNVMLWGPPGTGKTLFANVLADKLDMDFCSITAGSLLQKDVGIQFLNEFERMARKSRYGMILFIDEADALFVDRNTLNIGSEQGLEHYKVLNHLLAMTGDGSSKFMLIAATNHAQNIDDAMGRRFQERIYMPLPDEKTRAKLVDLYINKLLLSEQDNGAPFVQHAKGVITSKTLKEIVQQTEGLSGAEIKDIIAHIQNLGLQSNNKAITAAHVQKAVQQGVQKRKDQENDTIKRQELAQNKGAVVQLTIQPTSQYSPDIQSSVPVIMMDTPAA